MGMGEIIKYHRERLELSQEALGAKLGVNKAAVQKWESGKVENLKRKTIKQLADIFKISPCSLMGWDDTYNNGGKLAKEVALIEQIQQQYGKDAIKLLSAFTKLNELGQVKALENISDLSDLPKYTDREKTESKNA